MTGENQLIFGFHAVHARLRHHPDSVREVFVHAGRHDPRLRDLVAAAQERGARVVLVDAQRLQGLVGHSKHQGVIARVGPIRIAHDLEDVIAAAGAKVLLLVLDGVTDPHNLGACLRVADALGAHAVVSPKDRSAGLTPTVAKVASGAADAVPFIPVTNLARTLGEMKEQGVRVIGADPSATDSLPVADLTGPLAWVLGGEGEGMRRLTRERCDHLLRIPMLGRVESLNVSVASALCLYETQRQRAEGARKALERRSM
jgi:23S rRNA (guanosine2251-2'-O)-methyltransferase